MRETGQVVCGEDEWRFQIESEVSGLNQGGTIRKSLYRAGGGGWGQSPGGWPLLLRSLENTALSVNDKNGDNRAGEILSGFS